MYNGSSDVAQHVPINHQGCFAFDSEVMEGRMEVHLRGLPTSNESLFKGKKRFFHVAVQVTEAFGLQWFVRGLF